MEKHFGALRFIATVLKILAWISLIGGILGGVLMVVLGFASGALGAGQGEQAAALAGLGALGGIASGLGTAIGGLLTFIGFLAAADLILVQLAIEENTREIAFYLKGGDFQRH